jgi:hypothetical protein
MTEVCREPHLLIHNGEQVFAFDNDHSIADIARWIMKVPADGEELRDTLNALLTGVYGLPMQ